MTAAALVRIKGKLRVLTLDEGLQMADIRTVYQSWCRLTRRVMGISSHVSCDGQHTIDKLRLSHTLCQVIEIGITSCVAGVCTGVVSLVGSLWGDQAADHLRTQAIGRPSTSQGPKHSSNVYSSQGLCPRINGHLGLLWSVSMAQTVLVDIVPSWVLQGLTRYPAAPLTTGITLDSTKSL